MMSYPLNGQQFLKSELTEKERDPEYAKFVVVPVPLEKTVSYGSGTQNGPQAIIEASNQLERYYMGLEPCKAGIVTQPPIECDGDMPDIMEQIAKRTQDIAKNGALPVTLGGEHSLTYGAVKGILNALQRPLGIIQIDAHADLREAYEGNPHSHASVMHMLLKENIHLAQFGVRALCQEEIERRIEKKVFYKDGEELVTDNIHSADLPSDFPKDVYVSFDVDGLDPSQMPATGTPVPGGLSYYQSIHLIKHALKGRNLVGCDIVELAPIEGMDGWNFTAAQITYALMSLAMPSVQKA